MAERCNADLFEVLIGQVTENREIDIVVGKGLGILGQAELFEPVRNRLHRGPSPWISCLTTLPGQGAVYPINCRYRASPKDEIYYGRKRKHGRCPRSHNSGPDPSPSGPELSRAKCPLLALSGHAELHCTCPLSGVKRTWRLHCQMCAREFAFR